MIAATTHNTARMEQFDARIGYRRFVWDWQITIQFNFEQVDRVIPFADFSALDGNRWDETNQKPIKLSRLTMG
jgi:hypothetical protein